MKIQRNTKGKGMSVRNRSLGGATDNFISFILSCSGSEFTGSKSIMSSDCLIYSWIPPIRK
jgi:hypothetical protein